MNIDTIKTPCYVIDQESLRDNINAFRNAFKDTKLIMGYSFKTNHNAALLNKAKEAGLFAEVVSDDEYQLALKYGFKRGNIIYNGPRKSIELVIDSINAEQITNLDSLQEVDMVINNKNRLNKSPEVGLRLNFDLEKYCINETTAGTLKTRFGISLENGDLKKAIERLHENDIKINCFHMHYSTKTRSLRVFKELIRVAVETVKKYDLYNEIRYIDVGGGFFYGNNVFATGKPSLSEYAKVINYELSKLNNKVILVLEPGASLISTTVKYYTRVICVKDIPGKRFCVCDGSLLHINPLMQSRDNAMKIYRINEEKEKYCRQSICGCTCMEMDRFGELDNCIELDIGDYIECDCAGAYTMVYNNFFINTPPYIYEIDNGIIKLVRGKDNDIMKQY